MNQSRLLLAALAVLMAAACASSQPRTDAAPDETSRFSGGGVKYYEEIRAPGALGPLGVECGVR